MCDFIYGVIVGVGSVVLGIFIDRHVRNIDISRSTWTHIRQDITTNNSIINHWEAVIRAENEFIEDGKGLLMQPLPQFRDDFWKIILNIMPDYGSRNENLINHLRMLSQNFEYLNYCSAEHQNIRNQFDHEAVKGINAFIIKLLNEAKYKLEELDKQYSIIIRFDEDKKNILKKILKKESEFRPIE